MNFCAVLIVQHKFCRIAKDYHHRFARGRQTRVETQTSRMRFENGVGYFTLLDDF